jgi:Mce-associated membrane protein
MTAGRGWFRRNVGKLAGCTAFGLVVAALIALGTVWYFQVRDANADGQRRDAALAAARQEVVNLTSVDKDSAQQSIQHLVDGATGDFRDQFSQQAQAYQQMVTDSQVASSGKIVESGVVSIDDKTAVVLAAATATVKNKDAPSGEQRVYRMRITLQNESDRWLVSKLEFVA